MKKWLDQQIAKQPVIKEEDAAEIAEESSADVADFITLLKESMKKKKSTEKTSKKKSS